MNFYHSVSLMAVVVVLLGKVNAATAFQPKNKVTSAQNIEKLVSSQCKYDLFNLRVNVGTPFKTALRSNRSVPVEETIQSLLNEAGIGYDRMIACDAMDHVKGAYCNKLYRLIVCDEKNNNENSMHRTNYSVLIAKIFSPLAQQRMISLHECLRFHYIAGQNKIGPKVVSWWNGGHSSTFPPSAILMHECVGRALASDELHTTNHSKSSKTRQLLRTIAAALVSLHQTKLDNGRNSTDNIILFHACEIMLDLCDENWCIYPHWTSLDQLRKEYESQKAKILGGNATIVDVGHGDFKPSNILLLHPTTQQSNLIDEMTLNIRFVDWDLVGRNYLAYDLAKLFRTDRPTPHTKSNRHYFLNAYASESNLLVGANSAIFNYDELERQTDLLLPMAWLEAAIFFVCMSTCSNTSIEASRWNALALERLEGYKESCRAKTR